MFEIIQPHAQSLTREQIDELFEGSAAGTIMFTHLAYDCITNSIVVDRTAINSFICGFITTHW